MPRPPRAPRLPPRRRPPAPARAQPRRTCAAAQESHSPEVSCDSREMRLKVMLWPPARRRQEAAACLLERPSWAYKGSGAPFLGRPLSWPRGLGAGSAALEGHSLDVLARDSPAPAAQRLLGAGSNPAARLHPPCGGPVPSAVFPSGGRGRVCTSPAPPGSVRPPCLSVPAPVLLAELCVLGWLLSGDLSRPQGLRAWKM